MPKYRYLKTTILFGFLLLSYCGTTRADTYKIDAGDNQHIIPGKNIELGAASNPSGHSLVVNGLYLLRDGKPWLPVMGEFHYSRYPQNQWRDELLKMKAGGIDIVASYIFWIHHEEIEGQFDWTGQRDLRKFVQTCRELEMPVIVRCGPWDHGEVRNGGLPEWLLDKGFKLRSDDPTYLDQVRIFYRQIADQLKGLLWKDGGPVVGVQFENEYGGPAQHLLNLKRMAIDLGLDVPLYTRTGWPELRTPMPFGEILPLYGGYAEGFWDRELTPMPGKYWEEFIFQPMRTNVTVASEQLGNRQAKDEAGVNRYPYLTCELGAGMMSSYHRRILFYPQDALSVVVAKLGSGSNLPGYYMYHGGTNPDGIRTTLNELQATRNTNYNDLPVKTYDFQAPLGEFGQVRPQYHLLRRIHMFLHDFGEKLATMPAVLPEKRPANKTDSDTLRWSIRSDGTGGFVFVNNYQRLQPMPPKPNTQFEVKLNSGSLLIPRQPVTVPADTAFYWPFNLDLGGAKLIYSTAQPICQVDDVQVRYTVFAPTHDVPAEFVFDSNGLTLESSTGITAKSDGRISIQQVHPGTDAAIRLRTSDGKEHRILLLDEATSLTCYKGKLDGKDRIFLTKASMILDGDTMRLQAYDPTDLSVDILPAPTSVHSADETIVGAQNGVFRHFALKIMRKAPVQATFELIRAAGPPREIRKGSQRVAESPSDADFDQAAVWRVNLPRELDPARRLLLRVQYIGDVARAELDGKLLTDNFYNGTAFDIGINRFGSNVYEKGLVLKILPLRKDAPIYLAKEALPNFATQDSVVDLKKIDVIEQYEAQLTLK